jgi:hypothetical protein
MNSDEVSISVDALSGMKTLCHGLTDGGRTPSSRLGKISRTWIASRGIEFLLSVYAKLTRPRVHRHVHITNPNIHCSGMPLFFVFCFFRCGLCFIDSRFKTCGKHDSLIIFS